jgi:hypothetical protein
VEEGEEGMSDRHHLLTDLNLLLLLDEMPGLERQVGKVDLDLLEMELGIFHRAGALPEAVEDNLIRITGALGRARERATKNYG